MLSGFHHEKNEDRAEKGTRTPVLTLLCIECRLRACDDQASQVKGGTLRLKAFFTILYQFKWNSLSLCIFVCWFQICNFLSGTICSFWIPGAILGAIVCLNWESYKVNKHIRMTWNEYRVQENKNGCSKPIWTEVVACWIFVAEIPAWSRLIWNLHCAITFVQMGLEHPFLFSCTLYSFQVIMMCLITL